MCVIVHMKGQIKYLVSCIQSENREKMIDLRHYDRKNKDDTRMKYPSLDQTKVAYWKVTPQ